MNYTYITDFHKSREAKIGASDIIYCIPHPEIQIESLAAWTDKKGQRQYNTAIDLYKEKVDGKDYEYSFPAEMGHYIEGKALYEFISDNISREIAHEFLRGYTLHKLEQDNESFKAGHMVCTNPEPYNTTPFKHNTEANTLYGVAHADCLFDPPNSGKYKNSWLPMKQNKKGDWIIDISGLRINLSKPFIIEAKSSQYHAVEMRKKDKYRGYDLTLKSWQGIPLKVYFQVQYQMALYGVETAYVSLIYNTSEKHYWQIEANKKHQDELVQIAKYIKQCIDSKTPPKQLAMNSKDIQHLYPEIKDDFRELKDEELNEALKSAMEYLKAKEQKNLWKKKEENALESAGIFLKDTEFTKGIIGGNLKSIAKWKTTGGGERLMGLKEIHEREDGATIEKYLKRKKLVKNSNVNKNVSIVIRKKDLEEWEENMKNENIVSSVGSIIGIIQEGENNETQA